MHKLAVFVGQCQSRHPCILMTPCRVSIFSEEPVANSRFCGAPLSITLQPHRESYNIHGSKPTNAVLGNTKRHTTHHPKPGWFPFPTSAWRSAALPRRSRDWRRETRPRPRVSVGWVGFSASSGVPSCLFRISFLA